MLHRDVGFVAEAAADIRNVHAHIGGRNAVRVGQVVAHDERANRGGPHFDGLVFFEPDDRAVRFDGRAGAEGIIEFAFQHHFRLVKTISGAPFAHLVHIGNVGAGDYFERGQGPVLLHVLMDDDRIFAHRLAGVDIDR